MTSATIGGTDIFYSYNALGQRIGSSDDSGLPQTIEYYSSAGQVIETDQVTWSLDSGSGTYVSTVSTFTQDVWGLDYVNDLVEEDSYSASDSGSSLISREYAITDSNYDVTGTTANAAGGAVTQRLQYDSYGSQTVMNSSYGAISDAANTLVGFQGGIMDSLTGLVHFDARDYNPVTGRWMEAEPNGSEYFDGSNLYQAFDSSPTNQTDWSGFDPKDYQDPNLFVKIFKDSGMPVKDGQARPTGQAGSMGIKYTPRLVEIYHHSVPGQKQVTDEYTETDTLASTISQQLSTNLTKSGSDSSDTTTTEKTGVNAGINLGKKGGTNEVGGSAGISGEVESQLKTSISNSVSAMTGVSSAQSINGSTQITTTKHAVFDVPCDETETIIVYQLVWDVTLTNITANKDPQNNYGSWGADVKFLGTIRTITTSERDLYSDGPLPNSATDNFSGIKLTGKSVYGGPQGDAR